MAVLELPSVVTPERARLILALGLFQDGDVSVGKAAEIAGLSYRSFLDVLRERDIPAYVIDEEYWEQELASLRALESSDAGAK
ncbi:UPF0175 family protein [Rubrivirga sp.]|uniref:UPF0175 family protein n=1 Tax=Rubrivirga sp. TaxID=1885344 RepID=UPI003C786C78